MPQPFTALPPIRSRTRLRSGTACVTIITLAAFFVLGYHPFAEDAGVYIPGIRLLLNPDLYPASRVFVTTHMQLSLFAPFLATIVRITRLSLENVLLLAYLFTLWIMVFAVWQLALQCYRRPAAQWAATTLVSLALGVPVAGTALSIADPYLSARSFSTPYILLAIAASLNRRPFVTILSLATAAAFHPLMATYGAFFILLLWIQRTTTRRALTLLLCSIAILIALMLSLSQSHAVEAPAYVHAATTRTYFYLAQWEWYEWIGILAPLLIFCYLLRVLRAGTITPTGIARQSLICASIAVSFTSVCIATLFVHPQSHSHLVARLQVMRNLHVPYIILFFLLGGWIGQHLSRRHRIRPALAFTAIACILFCTQRLIYPASLHLELPGCPARNSWQQAFLWVAQNTPSDAYFALDAHYITAEGEDAHSFRAIAQRSSVSDFSKDGGSAAIFPQLAEQWEIGQQQSMDLSSLTDTERMARLVPLHVNWIILQRQLQTGAATTHFNCPYRNSAVLVCQLPSDNLNRIGFSTVIASSSK